MAKRKRTKQTRFSAAHSLYKLLTLFLEEKCPWQVGSGLNKRVKTMYAERDKMRKLRKRAANA